tara:strand:- start:265 stop:876 length:612 start_codon:yes stop_codon:yes gene_type:complete
MTWRRKIAKIVGAAALVGALIGIASKPASAELSKKDQAIVGELRETNQAGYDSLQASVDTLSANFKVAKTSLDSLKKVKVDSVNQKYQNVVKLYKVLRKVYWNTWPGFIKIRDRYGLSLNKTNNALNDLVKELDEAILDNIEESIKLWRRQARLTSDDIEKMKKLNRVLEEMEENYYKGKKPGSLRDQLRGLMGRGIKSKFPG